MIKVDFFQELKNPFNKKIIQKLVDLSSKYENRIKGGVEVAIIGEKEIKKLNNEYRGKNKVTDVLSFPWKESPREKTIFLGQIYICYPQIKKQANDFEVEELEEFARMLVHGLLHLVGYDHVNKREAEKMFGLQEKIVLKAKEKRII